jgi:hypothetical protein
MRFAYADPPYLGCGKLYDEHHQNARDWVKPFAIFKPNVNPAYTWEPVIVRGGRKYTRDDDTVRDWVSANITLKRGLTGAKPRGFCRWVFALLNAQKSDVLDDLFPGSLAVSIAWAEWCARQPEQQTFLTRSEEAVEVAASGGGR